MSDERLIIQRLADEFLAVDPTGLRWAEGTVHGLVHDAFEAGRDYERDEARREVDEARRLLEIIQAEAATLRLAVETSSVAESIAQNIYNGAKAHLERWPRKPGRQPMSDDTRDPEVEALVQQIANDRSLGLSSQLVAPLHVALRRAIQAGIELGEAEESIDLFERVEHVMTFFLPDSDVECMAVLEAVRKHLKRYNRKHIGEGR